MITWINKFGGVLFFSICMFSSFLHLLIEGGFASLSKLPLDNEYRLKFVDSVQYEIGLSEIIKIIYPVEILSYRENSGVIEVKTYENSVVYSPIDCVIENEYSLLYFGNRFLILHMVQFNYSVCFSLVTAHMKWRVYTDEKMFSVVDRSIAFKFVCLR